MNFKHTRIDYYLQFGLMGLILLPPIVYIAFTSSLSAELSLKNSEGQTKQLAVTGSPILNYESAPAFFKRAAINTMSADWQWAVAKYSAPRYRYFSGPAWDAFKDFQEEDGAPEHMQNHHIVRYLVSLEEPVIVSQRRDESGEVFLMQGKFLKTYRGRSSQESSVITISATVKALSNPSNGEAVLIMDWKESRSS